MARGTKGIFQNLLAIAFPKKITKEDFSNVSNTQMISISPSHKYAFHIINSFLFVFVYLLYLFDEMALIYMRWHNSLVYVCIITGKDDKIGHYKYFPSYSARLAGALVLC